jgi:RNA polymerase sigma-70 factor (ECF subfamily)
MTEPDAAHFELAVTGDADALTALLEYYGPRVAAEIQVQIGRPWQSMLDADDVMQVTYIEAFLHIRDVTTRDPAGFLAWLRRIAMHNLQDALRVLGGKKRPPPQRRVQEPGSEESYVALIGLLGADSATPSRSVARGEARSIVESALEQLPADYAAVVRMYDLEGRDIDEVARTLGRSPGAVHMLRARAHDRVRPLLGSPSKFFGTP